MEADAVSSRPESPKKKVKSAPSSDSEAQPSNYSESCSSTKSTNRPAHNSAEMNGSGVAPTRKYVHASVPDSSSERTSTRPPERNATLIQEGEVSSSENSVPRAQKERAEVSASGNADSLSNEPEDLTVCDSASCDSNERL